MSTIYGPEHRTLQDRFDTRRLADNVEDRIVRPEIGERAQAFIEARDMFWLASIDHQGRPTVSYKGGDFNWVQVQAPALLTALASGRVDAATLIHAQAFKAHKSGKYRVVAYTNKDIRELFGVDSVAAVNVTYPEKLKARPAAFREFNRMLRESVLYAVKNAEEVGKAISKTQKISPAFFKAWLADYSYFPGAVSDQDMKAMETVWQNAKEMGIIKKVPRAKDVVWEHAIRE